jgi:hypothetical protein
MVWRSVVREVVACFPPVAPLIELDITGKDCLSRMYLIELVEDAV